MSEPTPEQLEKGYKVGDVVIEPMAVKKRAQWRYLEGEIRGAISVLEGFGGPYSKSAGYPVAGMGYANVLDTPAGKKMQKMLMAAEAFAQDAQIQLNKKIQQLQEGQKAHETEGPHALPIFRGYTVDLPLREFRKPNFRGGIPRGIEFLKFDTEEGDRLLADWLRTPEGVKANREGRVEF
mgnify:CR=1 FL=1